VLRLPQKYERIHETKVTNKKKKYRTGLDFVHQELIGFQSVVVWNWKCCGLQLVDIMCVTGCPTLTPVNTSSEFGKL